MNWLLLCRLLGLLGMLVGGSMVFSLPWAFPLFGQTDEFEADGFFGIGASILVSVSFSGALFAVGRHERSQILRKEALGIVGLGWLLAGVMGALPYVLSGTMRAPGVPMTLADALFESCSGFTTTGASVLTNVEDPQLVPRCVLFWRSFTHWLGGMGIIVLFVAILGHLGAGGKALLRREVPGPTAEPVRPRVRETAVVMWLIYLGLSGLLTVLLLLQGLSIFDALCHTFGTLATGGFSTYNRSVAHFESVVIEVTIIVFMIAAGTNFSLYYLVLQHKSSRSWRALWERWQPLWRDPEFRTYLAILAAATLFLTVSLVADGRFPNPLDALRYAAFQAVAIMTTTGFATDDFHQWAEHAKGLLLLLMFIGGCAGSTGGGVKVIRVLLFLKALRLEVEHAFRPNLVRQVRIGGKSVDPSQRHDVIVYVGLVLLVFVSGWMLLAAIEPASQWEGREPEMLVDCASAVAATLNNIGPGLGVLGPARNYAEFSPQGKILLTILMLLGRLELFAILVLFVPSFWRPQ